MSNYLNKVKNKREAILTGEIGALLHDIGKLHPHFVKSKSVEKTAKDKHAQIDEFLKPELIKFIKNSKFDITVGNEKSAIYNLITQHHPDKNTKNEIDDIVKLLIACDYKDSADDKGVVRKKQHLGDTWIVSPFGYKKERIDVVCLQKRFEDLENNLIGLFKGYISGTMSLSCFRESLMNTLKTSFSHALGETRIPSNDVTLWDHSYSTASLFKSLLTAKVCGANVDLKKPQWRIFGICWNGIDFINRGKKIAEIKARGEIIEKIKEKLRNKFEDEIPVGNVIYEDMNGIYFTFPNLNESTESLAMECARISRNIILKESNNELWPFFTLSRASSTLTIIAEELKFASEKRKIPRISPTLFIKNEEGGKQENIESNFDLKAEFERLVNEIKEGRKDAKIDICPICRIRPKDEKAERCEICEDRRMGRLEQWLSNRQDTVWIDEVADKNNRVALISLNFYLDKWLDGTMIGTHYSQSFEDWYESRAKKIRENIQFMNKIKKSINREPVRETPDELGEYFMDYFIKEVLADPEFNTSQNDVSLRAKILNTFFEDIKVSEKEKDEQGNDNPLYVKNVWENIKEKLHKVSTKNALLLLFTQNPSPARLYRIWNETEEFFDLIVRKIQDEIYSNKWRRIRFTVSNGDLEQKLKDSTTYMLKIDNLEPENLLVFHNKDGEFYAIESLEKFEFNNKSKFNKKKGEEAVKEALKQGFKHLALEDEPDKNLLKFSSDSDEKIKPDEKSIETEEYYPLIEINRSPLSLRLIVPALDSMKIIGLITKLYNERFEKVLGKLPLNVKLLVAKRKFPLYILLDAEKRMLEGDEFKTQKPMNPWWDVDGHRYGWYYSFYPTKTVEKGEGYTLDNISSISKGKIFRLYPGYFDFELLLGTTDRYSIYYKGKKRGGEDYKLFSGRPYYFYQISEMLELWDILSENLSASQINFIEEMITSKLREWREIKDGSREVVLREFAEAILKDTFGNKWKDLREETKFFLVNYAISGLLLDTIILFRHVIKCGGEENE